MSEGKIVPYERIRARRAALRRRRKVKTALEITIVTGAAAVRCARILALPLSVLAIVWLITFLAGR